ncbi:MAG: SDR family oxidoreductase [Candidatus Hodarchaeales archaeon]|jgi:NADP-dependent 3-hydroxy acid dehydrogenase YdfG
MKLEEKVAIITGASKGIGKAIALKFAENGMNVVLAARNEQLLNDLKSEIERLDGDALVIPTDVTSEDQVKFLVKKAIDKYRRIDVLVNNAGVGRFKRVDEFTLEDYNYLFDVNMKGLFLVTKYVVPHMLSRESGQIINIASIAGKSGFKMGTLYSATKHAVVGYSWSLREDLKEQKIKVSVVCPGSVVTEFGGKKPDHVEWAMEADDVAHAVMFLVTESDTVNTAEVIIKPRYNPRKINFNSDNS